MCLTQILDGPLIIASFSLESSQLCNISGRRRTTFCDLETGPSCIHEHSKNELCLKEIQQNFSVFWCAAPGCEELEKCLARLSQLKQNEAKIIMSRRVSRI